MHKYRGLVPATVMGYVDAATGRTLNCVPGGVYDIYPEPPDNGLFELMEDEDPGEEESVTPTTTLTRE